MRKAMQLKSKMKEMALKNKLPAQAVLQNFMLERPLKETFREDQTSQYIGYTLCRMSQGAVKTNSYVRSGFRVVPRISPQCRVYLAVIIQRPKYLSDAIF